MSYALFGVNGSHVYVFLNSDGHLECCGCRLRSRSDTVFTLYETVDGMIAHLQAHEAAGHCVPGETYEALRADRENGELA